MSGFQYTTDKPDSFVIDMDSFSHGGLDKEINQNPRITVSLLPFLFLGKVSKSVFLNYTCLQLNNTSCMCENFSFFFFFK